MRKEALERVIDGTLEDRKFLVEKNFGLFALYYFQHYFHFPLANYHYDMIQDCHDLLDGDIRELLWVMYRESAKTTFTKLFIIYLICHKKKIYINVDSFDKENAERILFDIAYELSNNKRLLADFGVLFSKKRGADDVKQTKISNFITENGIRVEAHSTQESVRGRIHLDQRPDFLVIDDFETNKTKDSQAYTKQVKDHISEALAGMSPDGAIIYLGNYITEYGNIQYLLDRAKIDNKLRVRNVPVVIDGKPAWKAKYAMTDEEAKLTGKVSIQDKQLQLGPQVFSYEMMNQPIDDSIAELKKEWIQTSTQEKVDNMSTLTFITIDSAVSEKESADSTAICINRVSLDNKWYVTNYKLKMNTADLIKHIFYLHETYNPKVIGLEKTTFTLAIKPFIEEEMRKRGVFFTIKELDHQQTKKETRIRALIPLLSSKTVFFVGDNQDIFDEMRVFPRGLYDDCLDAMAYQLQVVTKPYEREFIRKLDYNFMEKRNFTDNSR